MKLVDVAIFTFPAEAAVLESILSEKNITYSLNNQGSSTIVPGTGTRISVREEDVDRVIEIIKHAGYQNNLL